MQLGQTHRAERAPAWYVLQVPCRRERAMASLISRVVPAGILSEPAFLPMFETEIKVRGEWVRVERLLFEGYVVAVTHDAEALGKALRLVVEPVRLLGTASGPVPLPREQAELFGGPCASGARVLPLSVGYRLADGAIAVERGPLVGHEGLIRSVERRKSVAHLELGAGGERIPARAGLALLPLPEGSERRAIERRAARSRAVRAGVVANRGDARFV